MQLGFVIRIAVGIHANVIKFREEFVVKICLTEFTVKFIFSSKYKPHPYCECKGILNSFEMHSE